MNLVDSILQGTRQLPPFPAAIQKVLQLMDAPKSSANEIVEVIQYDQAMTANVLRTCNTVHFGLRRPVNSLRDALVRIGFKQLLEIIMNGSSVQLISRPCPGYGLESGDLWRHSVSCALLSQVLSERIGVESSPVLFTASLLHDIGKVILSGYVQEHFQEIQRKVLEEGRSFSEAEKEVLGIDHAELGGRICEQWHFPEGIISVTRFHHSPFSAPGDSSLVQQVYLCDLVALMSGIGGGSDGLYYHAHKEIMKTYRLKERDLEQMMIELNQRLPQVEAMFGLQ